MFEADLCSGSLQPLVFNVVLALRNVEMRCAIMGEVGPGDTTMAQNLHGTPAAAPRGVVVTASGWR